MVELLAPAGSFESLQAAVNAGADAVYIGGAHFGARAYADNPDEEHLKRGMDYCHLRGRKLYLTVNTLLKEQELEEKLYPYLAPYYENGLDAVIVQDLGVLSLIRQYFPEMELHASTQMTVTSSYGAGFLKRQGVHRVVLARELSLSEIKAIIQETGVEVETFIHGAMCYSYSGQCLLSSMIGGRSGNRGRCAQPCRLLYSASEQGEKRKKERQQYLLSMKDMCTLDLLPELIEAGIASLKIEGRMKRPEYTAGTVSIYRKYIDRYYQYGADAYQVDEEDRRMLMDLYNRGGFSDGYYHIHNGRSMMALDRPNHLGTEAARITRSLRGQTEAVALEPLYKRDVLEMAPGHEITLSADVRQGASFLLPCTKAGIQKGRTLHRTKSENLLASLREKFLDTGDKEKIKGELRIFCNSPAILKLRCKDIEVVCSRDIAEKAVTVPTDEAAVRRQMNKTGNTPFVFETLEICLDEGLFVPVRALNELRRCAMEALEHAVLEQFYRKPSAFCADTVLNETGSEKRKNPKYKDTADSRLTVSVMTRGQLGAVLAFDGQPIDTVYLDSMLLGDAQERKNSCAWLQKQITALQGKGCRCFFNCPPVLRFREQKLLSEPAVVQVLALMDGFLVHTADELAYIQEITRDFSRSTEIASDADLYACNSRALAFLKEQGVSRTVFSQELNFRELGILTGEGRELTVYGYQALMQSAQCVVKNTKGCTKMPEILYLRDRKNAYFPVQNRCSICCNTIYNSVPLQLGGCRTEIARLAPDYIRLSFTIESARETEKILAEYGALLLGERRNEDADLEGTRGHFRRGVE